jgi:2-methylcitrate dehydratase PrpD
MKLTLADLVTSIRKSDEDTMLIDLMIKSQSTRPASLVALQQIYRLYSQDSSDNANINRITINLETIAADLISISKSIKKLDRAR